jgi:Rrf2 family protein
MFVAQAPAGTPVLIAQVGKATGAPEEYLRKVFQQLARSGVVSSRRGSRGGFLLSRPSDQITLRHIVESIDGSLPAYSCLRDSRHCGLPLPCPVQKAFDEAQRRMAEVLESTSLSDLLEDIEAQESTADWLALARGN